MDATVQEQTGNADLDAAVDCYVQLRDRIRELEKRHEAELSPHKVTLEKLSGKIMDALDGMNVQSIKTKHGTAYTSVRFSASLADPEAFMKFVKDNDAFQLMDKRANATAVKDYVATHGLTPPGCNLTALKTLGVNRPRS